MEQIRVLLHARRVALVAVGLIAALVPVFAAGAQGYPLPPKVTTVITANGLPTTNPPPNSVVTISTQLSDASGRPLVNAEVTFTISAAPAGSDAGFAPPAASTLDPSSGTGRQLLASLLGVTSINVRTDQAGTAKAQLNTGSSKGDLVITTSVGGTIVGTTKLSVGGVAPLPPSTGSGFDASVDSTVYLLAGALGVVVAIATIGWARRRRS